MSFKIALMSVVLIPIVFLSGIYLGHSIQEYVYQDSHPGYLIGVAEGSSMEPRVHSCDIQLAKTNEFKDVDVGDYIVYKGAGGKKISHIYIGNGKAKGINNESIDPVTITSENYIGEIIYNIPTSNILSDQCSTLLDGSRRIIELIPYI